MAGKIYKLCLCNYAITLGEDFANIDAQSDAILRQPNQLWNDVSACHLQCESKKKSPLRGPDISHFSHKRLRIFNRFFTHLLFVPIYARLQIFIQLSPTLTKLCHIKRDYPVHIICAKCPKRARSDVCVSR